MQPAIALIGRLHNSLNHSSGALFLGREPVETNTKESAGVLFAFVAIAKDLRGALVRGADAILPHEQECDCVSDFVSLLGDLT